GLNASCHCEEPPLRRSNPLLTLADYWLLSFIQWKIASQQRLAMTNPYLLRYRNAVIVLVAETIPRAMKILDARLRHKEVLQVEQRNEREITIDDLFFNVLIQLVARCLVRHRTRLFQLVLHVLVHIVPRTTGRVLGGKERIDKVVGVVVIR